MGTRSNIGIIEQDGTARMVYCHWDGYLSNNGRILMEDYQSADKIRELLELGAISQLNRNVGAAVDQNHTWRDAAKGVTVAYTRDRGDKLSPAEACPPSHFARQQEYLYLYDTREGKWYACSHSHEWAPLDVLLAADE
jgi:hypothetical protein